MEDKHEQSVTVEHWEKVYTGIREMVQFGEAKNGLLMGLNVAILYNVSAGAISFASPRDGVLTVLALAGILASTLTLLISLFPKFKNMGEVNPLFFGSVAKTKREDYYKLCANLTREELLRYYATQIHANSQIALRKFRDFRLAIGCAVPSYLLFTLLYILNKKGW